MSLVCHSEFWCIFSLTGLFGGYSLLPRQFYHASNLMTWTQAESYCRLKYTDLLFVYNEEDLDKMMASHRPWFGHYAWIGGFNLNSESDPQNITENGNSEIQKCLAIDTDTWKLVKKTCTQTLSFFCSQSEYLSAFWQM